jgi:hypothetical protein
MSERNERIAGCQIPSSTAIPACPELRSGFVLSTECNPAQLTPRLPLRNGARTRRGRSAIRPQLLAQHSKSLAHNHQPEYRHANKMRAKLNAQRGAANLVVIILISIGAVIVLALLGIYLFTPRLDVTRKRVNESTAMANLRNIGVNQVNYYSSFGDAGYARDLASLGPGADGKCGEGPTAAHACMITGALGNSVCTGANWCTQNEYKFNVQGICASGKCTDYVISATPVNTLNGSRNFCATSDNAIRFETAAPKSAPFSLKECQALQAMQ